MKPSNRSPREARNMSNVETNLNLQLLVKIGSALVHADEFLSPHGHPFDKQMFHSLMEDPEVKKWVAVMTKDGFLPVKRNL